MLFVCCFLFVFRSSLFVIIFLFVHGAANTELKNRSAWVDCLCPFGHSFFSLFFGFHWFSVWRMKWSRNSTSKSYNLKKKKKKNSTTEIYHIQKRREYREWDFSAVRGKQMNLLKRISEAKKQCTHTRETLYLSDLKWRSCVFISTFGRSIRTLCIECVCWFRYKTRRKDRCLILLLFFSSFLFLMCSVWFFVSHKYPC